MTLSYNYSTTPTKTSIRKLKAFFGEKVHLIRLVLSFLLQLVNPKENQHRVVEGTLKIKPLFHTICNTLCDVF